MFTIDVLLLRLDNRGRITSIVERISSESSGSDLGVDGAIVSLSCIGETEKTFHSALDMI